MAYSTLLGRVVRDRYRLEASLGSGASADVYRALDIELDRYVAVKLVHPGLAGDERFLRRFQSEARAVAALNHPNIVQIHDWGREDGQPFLVLQYLSGGSLRDLLLSGANLGTAEVVHLGAQIARALELAHSKGIVHRDIKPANLLLDESGNAHLTDFGIARAMVDATWTEHIGTVFGTARYASPEQASGENVGAPSDVYSLGIVCYEALVGEAPFVADTPVAMLMARTRKPLPSSPMLGPLAPVLVRATAMDPRERLDAGAFADALESLALKLPPPDTARLGRRSTLVNDTERSGWDELTAVGVGENHETTALFDSELEPSLEAAATPPAQKARNRKRRRLIWAACLVVLLVLLGGGAAIYVHDVEYGHAVPRLDGVTLAVAQSDLHHSALRVGTVTHSYSPSVPAGRVVRQSLTPGAHVRADSVVGLVVSLGHAPVVVPKLVGLTASAAATQLRQAGFVDKPSTVFNETVVAGDVVAASPSSGRAAYGSTVSVQISNGPQPRTIPSLEGLSYVQARADLIALRLGAKAAHAYSDSVPAGEVISSQPASGATGIPVGTTVTVTVSRGPQLVAVPNVSGDSVPAAVAALQAVGLDVTEEIGPPFAMSVSTTDPAPASMVAPGTDVTLYTA